MFVIAVLGAVTGVGFLLWQVYAWREEGKTKVEVSLRGAVLGYEEPLHVASVGVVNNNNHALRIASVGFEDSDGSQVVIVKQLPGASLPGLIPAHDSGSAFLAMTDFEEAGLDRYSPVAAWARTSTRHTFKSPFTRMMSRD